MFSVTIKSKPTPISDIIGEDKTVLVMGLCNDAIGYIVPDHDYNAKESHEMISVGPNAASTLSKAFIELIGDVKWEYLFDAIP